MIVPANEEIDHRLAEIAADITSKIEYADTREEVEYLVRMACLLYALERTERELRENNR